MASKNDKVNVIMQIVVSLFLLVAGILILTSPNAIIQAEMADSTQKIAAGWVGGVLGYWLS